MSDKFTKIYNNHMRTKEYLEFMDSKYFSTYMFLRGAIIRDSEFVKFGANRNTETYALFYTYFKNGKLVSHYALSSMAKYFNKTKGAISKRIKELEKKGFIKIHRRLTKDGVANDYEFGYYTGEYGTGDYTEHYYLDEYFDKIYQKQRDEREAAKFEASFHKVSNEDKIVEIDINKFDNIVVTENSTLKDVILQFNNPKDYVDFRMHRAGRTFDTIEADKSYREWYKIYNSCKCL